MEDALTDPAYDRRYADVGRLAADARRAAWCAKAESSARSSSVAPRPARCLHSHEMLLTTFADQAVIAIENVRLFNETQGGAGAADRHRRDPAVISGSPTDVQPVFDAIVQRCQRACSMRRGADRGAARAAHRCTDGLRLRRRRRARRAKALPDPCPLSRRASPAPRCCDGRSVHVADAAGRVRLPSSRSHTRLAAALGYRAVLCVPMLRDGEASARCRSCRRGRPAVSRQADRAAADLRRPGGDRDRERAAVQRDARRRWRRRPPPPRS